MLGRHSSRQVGRWVEEVLEMIGKFEKVKNDKEKEENYKTMSAGG